MATETLENPTAQQIIDLVIKYGEGLIGIGNGKLELAPKVLTYLPNIKILVQSLEQEKIEL